jgi:hypothetical protein
MNWNKKQKRLKTVFQGGCELESSKGEKLKLTLWKLMDFDWNIRDLIADVLSWSWKNFRRLTISSCHLVKIQQKLQIKILKNSAQNRMMQSVLEEFEFFVAKFQDDFVNKVECSSRYWLKVGEELCWQLSFERNLKESYWICDKILRFKFSFIQNVFENQRKIVSNFWWKIDKNTFILISLSFSCNKNSIL